MIHMRSGMPGPETKIHRRPPNRDRNLSLHPLGVSKLIAGTAGPSDHISPARRHRTGTTVAGGDQNRQSPRRGSPHVDRPYDLKAVWRRVEGASPCVVRLVGRPSCAVSRLTRCSPWLVQPVGRNGRGGDRRCETRSMRGWVLRRSPDQWGWGPFIPDSSCSSSSDLLPNGVGDPDRCGVDDNGSPWWTVPSARGQLIRYGGSTRWCGRRRGNLVRRDRPAAPVGSRRGDHGGLRRRTGGRPRAPACNRSGRRLHCPA